LKIAVKSSKRLPGLKERYKKMSIDHPHGGENSQNTDSQIVEAKRLSLFYKGLGIKVHQASDYFGRCVGMATVVKNDAVALARKKGGRVYIFEEGMLVGYC
jgi:hypothetical protein